MPRSEIGMQKMVSGIVTYLEGRPLQRSEYTDLLKEQIYSVLFYIENFQQPRLGDPNQNE